jgi:hypothetical protein
VHLRGAFSQWTFMILAICLAVMVTASCSLIPYRTSYNQPICPEGTALPRAIDYPEGKGKVCVADGIVPVAAKQEPVPRSRQYFSTSDPDVPDVFVGPAISGGGSRAAAFGMAVLEQLQQLGILQHVTAISTTSGGGLAGAYYAAKGTEIDWGDAKQRNVADQKGRPSRRL